MEELIKALGHIKFYLADADEIFSGRKIKTFDRERIRIFLEVEMLKDMWFAKFRNCYAASVIPSGQLYS